MRATRLNVLASALVLAALAATAVGCGHVGQLKEAASVDLNCPKNRVHVSGSGSTRDVDACNQRATYTYEDGDWRMIARSVLVPAGQVGQLGQSQPQPAIKAGGPPAVAPAQPAPTFTATGTPSMPPSSPPPPSQPHSPPLAAPGQKSL